MINPSGGETPRILIVVARFYDDIADALIRGAVGALTEAGADHDVVEVPGAFEIPATIAMALADRASVQYDGFVALGCVIRGETTHYDYVCGESARGLMDLSLRHAVAIGYGILTCENREQAMQRARVDAGNKGAAAVDAALRMADLKTQFGLAPR